MNCKPKTLTQTLGRSLGLALVAFGVAAQPLIWGSNDHVEAVVGEAQTQVDRPVADGAPAELLAEHDCWSGEAPVDMQGVVPGHVVVAKGSTPRYAGATVVGQALDQIFNGVDHGLVVYGFCR
jgi:hypothetical protein